MKRKILCLLSLFALTVGAYSQDAEGVYAKVDEAPAPTKTAKPVYPTDLKREGVEGIVALSCVIDEKGDVISVRVNKSSDPRFEAPAREALQKWKFKPAKKDGKEVKVRVTIPFRFNLEE